MVKQSLGYIIISYLGFFLSILASLFLYPENLEIHGILRSILTASEFLSQIFLFGSALMVVKFYPDFVDRKGLLSLGIMVITVIFTLVLLLFFLDKDKLIRWSFIKNKQFAEYTIYSIFLGLFLAYAQLLSKYISNYGVIAVPSFLMSFLSRMNLIIAFLLGGYFLILSHKQMLIFFILGYALIVLLLINYLRKFKKITLRIPKMIEKSLLRTMLSFNFFTFISTFGNLLTFKIDTLMIPSVLAFRDNSIYSICFALGSLINIPFMAIYSISSPKITTLLSKNKIKHLGELYQKTSLFLFTFGLLFLGLILLGTRDVFSLLPRGEELLPGYWVVIWVSFSSWFSISCGFNDQIIAYSPYYKFNIIAVLFLAGLNISLNYYFLEIRQTGIIGPAVASFISVVLFNLVKLIFIYFRYKILPFSSKNAVVLSIGIIAFFIAYLIPSHQKVWQDLLIKCSAFSVLFIGVLWALRNKIFPNRSLRV